MNKLRIYIINIIFSSLIGAVIEVISTIFENKNAVDLSELFESMAKGGIIGTFSLFVFFYVFMRFKSKPIAGFISNFMVVAVLMAIVTLFDFIEASFTFFNSRWIVAFIMAEILSFVLTAVWYRQMTLYNDKLKRKKASIVD